jgi:LL-diaminopimelate aminotransferase
MFSSHRGQSSGPIAFSDLCRRRDERIRQGLQVINLGIGIPDLSPPAHVRQILAHASLNPDLHGHALADRPGLRHAAAGWYRSRFGVHLDPDREILSLPGSQGGLMHIGLTLLDPGVIVLVPDLCSPAFTA